MRHAPFLGADTDEVLHQVLGFCSAPSHLAQFALHGCCRYNNRMRITFDPAKRMRKANEREQARIAPLLEI